MASQLNGRVAAVMVASSTSIACTLGHTPCGHAHNLGLRSIQVSHREPVLLIEAMCNACCSSVDQTVESTSRSVSMNAGSITSFSASHEVPTPFFQMLLKACLLCREAGTQGCCKMTHAVFLVSAAANLVAARLKRWQQAGSTDTRIWTGQDAQDAAGG